MSSPESLELAHAWMTKARSDLATARLLIEGQEKYLDTGSYHCQQAAEKALKAWLTAQEIIFPKTHVLEELLELCIPTNPGFGCSFFRPKSYAAAKQWRRRITWPGFSTWPEPHDRLSTRHYCIRLSILPR
jgi:hypothetical protein